MKILVINSGSSSIKYQLIETTVEAIADNADHAIARGSVERIGTSSAIHTYKADGDRGAREVKEILEHRVAITEIIAALTHPEHGVVKGAGEIEAVGHRVVHGGEKLTGSVRVTPEVLEAVDTCIELAPLHNPHNLRGYHAAHAALPDVPHVMVFDTAYHHTLPPYAYLYGLPYVLYSRHGVRRYGFHGTSHRFVAWRSEALLGRPRSETRLITCHLGSGASVCAIRGGRSIDTSMGFTPLEGLLMGTRSGDLDPSVVFYVMHKEDLTLHQANTMLNKHSGLQGISGISNDMAELLAEEAKGNERAKLAVDAFCYRLRKYIAAYVGALGGADAVMFAGGIGERSPAVRARTVEGLDAMGIRIDPARNEAAAGQEAEISPEGAPVRVFVVPTNEELIIARDTLRVVLGVLAPAGTNIGPRR